MAEPKDDLAWVEEHAVEVHENKIFRVEQRRMRRTKAAPTFVVERADFFVIETPSWVNIVALTAKNKMQHDGALMCATE